MMAEKAYIERSEVLDTIRHSDSLHSAYIALAKLRYADVRPVARGRWEWDVLDGTPGYRPVVLCCSNCHRVSFSGWSYCPNCGADMREES